MEGNSVGSLEIEEGSVERRSGGGGNKNGPDVTGISANSPG